MEKQYHITSDESEEFPTEERCHILELLGNHSDADLSIARARVEPGVTTAWHRLAGTAETYYIVSGSGLMYIDEEEPFEVKASDLVAIPAGAAQRISNPDPDRDLVFLAICNPAFKDKNYESLEVSHG